jgi:hypothetical protein
MYEGIAYSALWKLMSWLPGTLLRRWVSREWLISRTRIDVRNRPTGVQIYGGEMPHASIWLAVHNGGYFPIELDRLTAELNLAGMSIEFFHLSRVPIPAESTREVYVRGPVPQGLIAHYTRNIRNGDVVSVSVRAEFNSAIHHFSVNTASMGGIKPDTANLPNQG